jgi:hypothetical protein
MFEGNEAWYTSTLGDSAVLGRRAKRSEVGESQNRVLLEYCHYFTQTRSLLNDVG